MNTLRFDLLDKKVVVCSNAGGYSDEVAEFAIGLMLASGKSIAKFDRQLRAGVYARQKLDELGRQVAFFRGKTIGIVGYGDREMTARIARAFGMKVLAYGRHPITDGASRGSEGRRGWGGCYASLMWSSLRSHSRRRRAGSSGRGSSRR